MVKTLKGKHVTDHIWLNKKNNKFIIVGTKTGDLYNINSQTGDIKY